MAFYAVPQILIELMGESGFHCCDNTPERGAGEEVQSVKHDVQAEFRSPEITWKARPGCVQASLGEGLSQVASLAKLTSFRVCERGCLSQDKVK